LVLRVLPLGHVQVLVSDAAASSRSAQVASPFGAITTFMALSVCASLSAS